MERLCYLYRLRGHGRGKVNGEDGAKKRQKPASCIVMGSTDMKYDTPETPQSAIAKDKGGVLGPPRWLRQRRTLGGRYDRGLQCPAHDYRRALRKHCEPWQNKASLQFQPWVTLSLAIRINKDDCSLQPSTSISVFPAICEDRGHLFGFASRITPRWYRHENVHDDRGTFTAFGLPGQTQGPKPTDTAGFQLAPAEGEARGWLIEA
ncbi:hypothetical protein FA13DRAFT_1727341 [Coprinellus micaceus]|uniref:Uncharacterized protein n=1 Tax=Coprinellus micaceus TaxID=71717 RepID=A0A4Y7TTQ4_COPMI|nr:hypothetical protein FA13DRAFT_1727341 [Coprinellus micaceus]